MLRQASYQSERLMRGRKGYLLVELRLSWVSDADACSALEVYSSRKIAMSFLDIHDGRAKVTTGSVMVYGSRKIVVGYAGIRNGCSVGHYGFLT